MVKGAVCKTAIHRFESGRRLHQFKGLAREGAGWVVKRVVVCGVNEFSSFRTASFRSPSLRTKDKITSRLPSQEEGVIASAAKQSLLEKESASSPEPALSPVEEAPRNGGSRPFFRELLSYGLPINVVFDVTPVAFQIDTA